MVAHSSGALVAASRRNQLSKARDRGGRDFQRSRLVRYPEFFLAIPVACDAPFPTFLRCPRPAPHSSQQPFFSAESSVPRRHRLLAQVRARLTKSFSKECNGARSAHSAAAGPWLLKACPVSPALIISARVAGGVWKTIDGGANWTPLFDKQDISSIGAIAVAPSDHNVVYVGTGEAAIRGNTTYGTGVYKSIDAGRTWKNVGLKDYAPNRRAHCPSAESRHRLVAALGHVFGPNRNVEFSGRPTAARRGRKFLAKTRRPAASMSCSIRIIPTLCSRLSGRRCGSRGIFPAAGREAACIARKTMA